MTLTNREKFVAQQVAARDRQAKQQNINEMAELDRRIRGVEARARSLGLLESKPAIKSGKESFNSEEQAILAEMAGGARLLFDMAGKPQLTSGRPVERAYAEKLVNSGAVVYEARIEHRGTTYCAKNLPNDAVMEMGTSKQYGFDPVTGRYSNEAVRSALAKHRSG